MWPGKGKWDPWDDYVEPKGKGKAKGKAAMDWGGSGWVAEMGPVLQLWSNHLSTS